METTVSMAFYKALYVKVREHRKTIQQDFDDPWDAGIFMDLSIPFEVSDGAELERMTKVALIYYFLQTPKRREASEAD